jgi:hypothetical protein
MVMWMHMCWFFSSHTNFSADLKIDAEDVIVANM